MACVPFRIWSIDRTKKAVIVIENNEKLYENLILKASQKLEINGSTLVIACDGTVIDENEALQLLQNEPLILLQSNETWEREFSEKATTVNDSFTVSDLSNHTTPDCSFSASTISLDETEKNNTTSQSGDTLIDFKIPWEKLSPQDLRNCETGKNNKMTTNAVINMIINEVRHINENPSARDIKQLAKAVIEKFPIFTDVDDDGIVYGDGSHTIFKKLLDRKNYLNRPPNRPESSLKRKINKVKKRSNFTKAGCSNWQPEFDNPQVKDSEHVDKKNILKTMSKSDDNFYTYLEDTYPQLRYDINKGYAIQNILQEWPVLHHSEVLVWQYKKLMNHSIGTLTKNILLKKNKFYETFQNIAYEEFEVDDVYKVLKILATYFKEQISCFIKFDKEGTSVENLTIPLNSPCVVGVVSEERKSVYYVYIEKIKINDGTEDISRAIEDAFASFFIFNMKYPANLSSTLTFVQNYFLKIKTYSGRFEKKPSTKLTTLINILKN